MKNKKTCTGCGNVLSLESFYLKKNGYTTSKCKRCTLDWHKQHRTTKPRVLLTEEEKKAHKKEQDKKTKMRVREALLKDESALALHKEKARQRSKAYNLKNKYGLTEQQLNILIEEQNNCCLICGDTFTKMYHIDHIEKEGQIVIRGLLCSLCNPGLGCFRDSPDRLLKAINYLENNLNFITIKTASTE